MLKWIFCSSIPTFIIDPKNPTLLEEWDDTIWMVMVEKAVIHKDKKITFKFYNGAVIEVEE